MGSISFQHEISGAVLYIGMCGKSLSQRQDLKDRVTQYYTDGLCELEQRIRSMYSEHIGDLVTNSMPSGRTQDYSPTCATNSPHISRMTWSKVLEWKPELKMMLGEQYDPTMVSVFNFFFLETAINTYVDDQGRHKLFDSETDLIYPPDEKRFRETLLESIDHASEFLDALEKVWRPQVRIPETGDGSLSISLRRAAQTSNTSARESGRVSLERNPIMLRCILPH